MTADPGSVPAAGGRAFFGPLEAFRGVAALIVAWFHAPFADGEKLLIVKQGAIFVDFFFILSGFVMAHAYLSKIQGGMALRDFALLRLARLYPLHLFMLAVWLPYVLAKYAAHDLYGIGTDPAGRDDLWSLLGNLALVQSMGLFDTLTWNGPAWSISVEVFAYLAFFAVAALAPRRWFGALAPLIAAAAFALLYGLGRDNPQGLLFTHDFGFVRCVASFFAGAALHRLFLRRPLALGKGAATALEALAVLAAVAAVLRSYNDAGWQLLTICSFMALLFVFAHGAGRVSALMSLPFPRYLGRISYSIYMVHAIVMIVVGNIAEYVLKMPLADRTAEFSLVQSSYATLYNVALLALVILIAGAVYRHVELRGKAWTLKRFARPAPAAE